MPGISFVDKDGNINYGNTTLRDTNGTDKGWYYSDKEKVHYKWDDKENKFVKRSEIYQILSSGTVLRYTDASDKGWYCSIDTEEHYRWDDENERFIKMTDVKYVDKYGNLTYGNTSLKPTLASNKGWYISDDGKTYYKWDNSAGKYVKQSDVAYVKPDGSYITKSGEIKKA